ncbi:helix-turn-helix domain-containing protein [Colwelliaceae bacterium 6471]
MKEQINDIIGKKLKKARKNKGWSLERTANNTGVSKAMLGQIERGESSPTITTLWKIASGLQQSFSSFITDENEAGTVAQSIVANFPDAKGIHFETIFSYQDDVAMEMYQLTIAGNYEHQASAHTPGVIEHIIVKQGNISIWFNEQWHHLSAGQVIRFNADQPHVYANQHDQVAIIEDIICYSQQGKKTCDEQK